MSGAVATVKNIERELEQKRKELAETEDNLKARLQEKQEEIAEVEKALSESQWQEKLDKVEEQLVAFYREERGKADQINRAVNKLFNAAAKGVEKINQMLTEIQELKKKISTIETGLVRTDDGKDLSMKEAMEFKRAEVAREIELAEQVKGGVSLVREVNAALGVQDESDEEFFGRAAHRFSSYAQNIYDEVRRAGGKPVRAREDELIRVARIPEPRIIRAREELRKNLDVLVEKELIVYEQEGDILTIREANVGEEVVKNV